MPGIDESTVQGMAQAAFVATVLGGGVTLTSGLVILLTLPFPDQTPQGLVILGLGGLLVTCIGIVAFQILTSQLEGGISDEEDSDSPKSSEYDFEPPVPHIERENDEFLAAEASAEELVEHLNQFPRVGTYILTRIETVYSPAGSEKIVTAVDTPVGEREWKWECPVTWDSEESNSDFVEFVEGRGYSRSDFHKLEGEPVLVSSGDNWTFRLKDPAKAISDDIEAGDLSWDEVQLAAIQDHFNLDLEVEGDSGIVVEDLPAEWYHGE